MYIKQEQENIQEKAQKIVLDSSYFQLVISIKSTSLKIYFA